MTESKLPHAIFSGLLSICSTAYAWFAHYGSVLATAVAIVAGAYSIAASRATLRKLRGN